MVNLASSFRKPKSSFKPTVFFRLKYIFPGGTFLLPKNIWAALEGRLMEEFGKDAKSKVILSDKFAFRILPEFFH